MKNSKISSLFLVTSLALIMQNAYANPDSYTHANGSTIVDINKADANGLSHNLWQDFNVTNKGMVLNNSMEDVIRPGGNIGKNNNLDSAAKVILNEVISTRASSLKGILEVAGQKADVIIANPNGITCSGCSFINTSRTTLTTGTPAIINGELTGFNVQKGQVKIDGTGLKNQQSFTDILAETIRINGQIETGELRAVAGKTAAQSRFFFPDTTTPSAAIDVSALGGVTAGVIQLQTTSAGAGVNNKGMLKADTLQIATNGTLSNAGSITAGTLTASANGLSNSGTVNGGAVTLASSGTLSNSGTIAASQILTATSSGKLTNSAKGTISGSESAQLVALKGDIDNKGLIGSDGTITAVSGYGSNSNNQLVPLVNSNIVNTGIIKGSGGITLLATSTISQQTGSLASSGDISLNAYTVNNAASILAKDLTVYSYNFENTGVMQADNDFTLTGIKGITNYGKLNGNTLTLNTEGRIAAVNCNWFILCTTGTLTADTLNINAPLITSVSQIGGTINAKNIHLNSSI